MGFVLNENSIITRIDNDAETKLEKEQEYLDYINEHINFVKKSFDNYIRPMMRMNNISTLLSDEEIKRAIVYLMTTIDTHDASKFSDAEFDGYRIKYYPTPLEESKIAEDEDVKRLIEERYDECWEHHYTVNVHHPKHWLNKETNIPEDMSLDAILEMICDWEAMSLKFGTSTLKWYENDAKDEKACISPKTKQIVEDLLYNVIHNSISRE